MVARTRESVMNALLTQLQTAGKVFSTYSRRWINWQDDHSLSPAPLLPLLVQWESPIAEEYSYAGRGMPPTRTWDVTLLVYGKIPYGETMGVLDGTTPAATVLNPLVDAVAAALDPATDTAAGSDKDGVMTLGGLVLDCRIKGQIVKALGDIDPSGICGAIIPVQILVQ